MVDLMIHEVVPRVLYNFVSDLGGEIAAAERKRWCVASFFFSWQSQVRRTPSLILGCEQLLLSKPACLPSLSSPHQRAYVSHGEVLQFNLLMMFLGGIGRDGFISIDCGNPNSSYWDTVTQVPYVSDDRFIDVGSDFDIQSSYINSSVPTQELNLRSFPDGVRNCYTLKPVPQNSTYLVRATFMYRNYDGKNSQIQFDLHIGVNHWKTMNISDPSAIYTAEALTLATANSTSVCLVNTGRGTPFMSSLELRPLKNGLYAEYVNASQSVVLVTRRNMGATKSLRFPDDPYDRVWNPYNGPSWLTLSTNSTVDNRDDLYEPPVAVMQTAVTPKRVRQLRFFWDSVSPGDELYAVLYFAELRNLTGKATRMFNVTRNGESRFSWYTPPYLSVGYIYSVVPFEGYYRYRYVLHATSNSTPPIINAFEVYSLMQLTQAATDSRDGKATLSFTFE
ncbi:receptor-like serine threonine-protein kinase [Musa troglodytarum]|uniref:Receptor-like serine threonine-protein kinase n=1 Tax=Musa troglodytarum TaxID=320322 RepID=A0A9E7JYE3_9LILI|nr:receptor-like serine threonine-protein kinase [Musa troglodytarum]